MGQTVYNRKYKTFKEGDEVYTTKNYRCITPNTPYTVLKCYTPQGMIEGYPGKVIEIITDVGFISKYASDKFEKTDMQIRQDKLNNILGEDD